MPQKIDLKEIARTNPAIDLKKLEDARALRRALILNGLHGRRAQNAFTNRDVRAKIVDDLENDPRLVRLQRF